MRLSLKVLGYEVISIDFESEGPAEAPKAVDRGIKAVSRWWVRGMAR